MGRVPVPPMDVPSWFCLTPLGRRVVRLAVEEIAKIEAAWFPQMRPVARPDELRATLQTVIRANGRPIGASDRAATNGVVARGHPVRLAPERR